VKKLSAAVCGKNKNKKLFSVFRLILSLPILLVAVFYLGKMCLADESDLAITEILYAPQGTDSASSKWIEIFNPGSDLLLEKPETSDKLKSLFVCELKTDGTYVKHQVVSPSSILIPANSYFIIATSLANFNKKFSFSGTVLQSSMTLLSYGNGKIIALSKDNKNCFGQIKYSDYLEVTEGNSLEKNISTNDWYESCAQDGTPGKENPTKEDCKSIDDTPPPDDTGGDTSKKPDYLDKVKINEIYPAPLTAAGEKEFVEIKNTSGIDLDFSKWCLKDKTENDKGDSGSCKKIDTIGKTRDFSVFHGTLSLNNDSKGDTVFLYDNNKVLADSRAYTSPKSKYAYAFDGTAWRWTSMATPEKENQFDKILSGKISKDDKIYANIYAAFEVAADDDAQKFTWDFGDGHKSYLQKTKHKYEKTGDFDATLKITGKGEDALYNFTVQVEKYSAPKIRIVNFSPNPKGSDTENEWLEIENKTKKKINLKGWSIATGWKNLYNHPIREDFFIKAGQIKKLLRDICAFTLANIKDKIELRDPSGKVVQKIQYDHGKKSIQENELYQKETGSNWTWAGAPNNSEKNLSTDTTNKSTPETSTTPEAKEVDPFVPTTDLGKYSVDPAWQKKQDYQIELINIDDKIKIPTAIAQNQPRVLGVRTISTQENHYAFTSNVSQKHWAITFSEIFWLKINSVLNGFLNKI